jgi:hypothetical protein
MSEPRAFLSYTKRDEDLATRLATDLRARRVDVWFASWELRVGDSLRRRIDEAIEKSAFFVVVLSRASLASEWVQTELDAATAARIRKAGLLLPVLVDVDAHEIPPTLQGVVWVRLADGYDIVVSRIADACFGVTRRPPLGSSPPVIPDPALSSIGLSPAGEALARFIHSRAKNAHRGEYVSQGDVSKGLGFDAVIAGLAVQELEEHGFVRVLRQGGMGVAGFSDLDAAPPLFIALDPLLCGWDPAEDGCTLAAAIVNARRRTVPLRAMDEILKWGPRRLNPAAEWLALMGYVRALRAGGCAPYTYMDASPELKIHRLVTSAP